MGPLEFISSEAKRTISHIKVTHTSGIDHKWEYLEKVVNQLIELAQDKTSKLEIATKSLEQINEMGYNELVCADHNALINKALQQIKEPG